MNHKITVPAHIAPEHADMYRAFTLTQSILQILVDNGVSILEAHDILGYTAVKCAAQLAEPESIVAVGQNFTDAYFAKTTRCQQQLLADPGVKVRLSAQNEVERKFAVVADTKKIVTMNIREDEFISPSDKPRIVVPH